MNRLRYIMPVRLRGGGLVWWQFWDWVWGVRYASR